MSCGFLAFLVLFTGLVVSLTAVLAVALIHLYDHFTKPRQ